MATRTSRPRYSAAQKLEIIQYAQSNSVKEASIRFKASRSSIYLWCEARDALERSINEHLPTSASDEETLSARAVQTTRIQEREAYEGEEARERQSPARPIADQQRIGEAPRAYDIRAQRNEMQRAGAHLFIQRGALSPPRTEADEHTAIDFALVGYMGEREGFAYISAQRTFSGLLSRRALPYPAFETTGYPQVSYLLDALQRDEVDYAFVATDTLLSNTHHATLDKLVASRLRMVGEVVSQDEICACALSGTELCDVDCIVSDWPTLQRCEPYILHLELQYGKRIHRQLAWDSAAACRAIRVEQAENTLAVCSASAALANGLIVLQSRVTGAPAFTRYTVLGHHGAAPLTFNDIRDEQAPGLTGRRCTLLVKGTERAILDVISAFAYRGLEIVSFHTRGGDDGGLMRSYVISYSASTDPLVERGLQQHLAVAAERVVTLGIYTTHSL